MQNNHKSSPLAFILPLIFFLIGQTTMGFSINQTQSPSGVYAHDVLVGQLLLDQKHNTTISSQETSTNSSSPFELHFIWFGTVFSFLGLAILCLSLYQLTGENTLQKSHLKTFIPASGPELSNLEICVQ